VSQVSPQIKVFALVGLIAAVALGGGMFFLSHQAAARASETPPPIQPKLAKSLAAPPAKAPAAAKPNAAASPAKPKAAEPPKPRAAAAPKPAAPTKPRIQLVEGLPLVLAAALQESRVVVVALYSPESPVDELAMKEVRAGARAAGAGFVALDALDEAHVGELVKQFGVMHAPATLVYRRPGTVTAHLAGFVDAQTVEQVAAAAAAR
jgi:hypothetical protein